MSGHVSQEYKGNGNHRVELVVEDGEIVVSRLRVPGGWLYYSHDTLTKQHTSTFVPMPDVVKHKV